MKVHLVIERESDEAFNDSVFGVFSSIEKATEIKDNLIKSFNDHNENTIVDIVELELDKVTDDYYFFVSN